MDDWQSIQNKQKVAPYFRPCSVTSVFTFKIENNFDEWAEIFDSSEADKKHSEFDIKPLFRGISKEDSQKVIVFIKLQRVIFKSV